MTPSLPSVSSASARRPKPAVPPKQGSAQSAASAVHVVVGAPPLGVSVGGVKNTATEQSTSAASERGRAGVFTGGRAGTGAKQMQNRLQTFQSNRSSRIPPSPSFSPRDLIDFCEQQPASPAPQAGPSPSSNVSPLASSPQDGTYESLLFPVPAQGAKDEIYESLLSPVPVQGAQASAFPPPSLGPYQALNDIEDVYGGLVPPASENVEDPVYEYLTIPIVGASERPLCELPIEFPAKKTKSKFRIFSRYKVSAP